MTKNDRHKRLKARMKLVNAESAEITPNDVRRMFHALWTKAVGQDDYVKAAWKDFRDAVEELSGLKL